MSQKNLVFLLGGDYSPEQWQDYPEILEKDIALMKQAGCNVMTLGMFAWSVLEKTEGNYDFSFLDEAIERLYAGGISVILGTPSAAMPYWLAKKYPEAARVDENMMREACVPRAFFCPSSPVYRQKVRAINEQLAKRYGNHPAVILWHISNEYQGIGCYCENCQNKFREWLKKKYNNDLNLLNKTLWNDFWSGNFSSWDEIDIPKPKSRTYGTGLYLEWKRFTTELYVDFMCAEAEPIRRFSPNIPITTNFHGCFFDLDYHKFKDYVDIISWDIYPRWHSNNVIDEAVKAGFTYDMCRSFLHKPFYIMENTPNVANFETPNTTKRPNMNILSSVQAVGHGADMIGYFQWRQSRGGYEKTHGAIVDHSGRDDTRIFKEICNLGKLLAENKEICGTSQKADVAIIYDWETRWTLDNIVAFGGKNKKYLDTCLKHYAYFRRNNIDVDIIGQDSDISKYKIVIAPMLYLIKHSTIERFCEYTKNGGTLVATYITGIADENDMCYLGGFPADELKDVFGIWAEETDSLKSGITVKVRADEEEFEAVDYCEYIHSVTADIIATFESDYFKGMPAALRNSYGKGTAYYIGFRDNGKYLNHFYDKITHEFEHYSPADGVFASKRFSDDAEYLLLQNFNAENTTVKIPPDYCAPDGRPMPETFDIPGYGVKILKNRK